MIHIILVRNQSSISAKIVSFGKDVVRIIDNDGNEQKLHYEQLAPVEVKNDNAN